MLPGGASKLVKEASVGDAVLGVDANWREATACNVWWKHGRPGGLAADACWHAAYVLCAGRVGNERSPRVRGRAVEKGKQLCACSCDK